MATAKPVKQPLTSQVLQDIVVKSTPDPRRFTNSSDPAVVTLFDLGVVGSRESALFCAAVKQKLNPWQIADSDIASSPASTVQKSADSLAENVQ